MNCSSSKRLKPCIGIQSSVPKDYALDKRFFTYRREGQIISAEENLKKEKEAHIELCNSLAAEQQRLREAQDQLIEDLDQRQKNLQEFEISNSLHSESLQDQADRLVRLTYKPKSICKPKYTKILKKSYGKKCRLCNGQICISALYLIIAGELRQENIQYGNEFLSIFWQVIMRKLAFDKYDSYLTHIYNGIMLVKVTFYLNSHFEPRDSKWAKQKRESL